MKKNKILIITTDTDKTTCSVIDWIIYLGYIPIIINENNKIKLVDFKIDKNNGILFNLECILKNNKKTHEKYLIKSSEILSSWYRRGTFPIYIETSFYFTKNSLFFKREEGQVYQSIVKYFDNFNNSINSLYDLNINKLQVLMTSIKNKMNVPKTFISNELDLINNFVLKEKKLITKQIGSFIFKTRKFSYSQYTTKVDCRTLQNKKLSKKTLGISMLQEEIDKLFEIRTFFLKDNCYSMAIFSQNNNKTKVDFRNYDEEIPNRTVPYKLPMHIKKKLVNIMNDLNMNSGSIDIIFSKNKKYYFLEVNPIGQFEQVSTPCNYYLYKKVAESLTK